LVEKALVICLRILVGWLFMFLPTEIRKVTFDGNDSALPSNQIRSVTPRHLLRDRCAWQASGVVQKKRDVIHHRRQPYVLAAGQYRPCRVSSLWYRLLARSISNRYDRPLPRRV